MVCNQLFFKKIDDTTGCPLAGAVFELRNENVVLTATSYTNGYVVFPRLSPGFYFLREIQAPEGYVLDNEPVFITVDFRGVVFINCCPVRRLVIGNIPETA